MRRLLSAYAGLALLIGLVCCVAGQSTCGFDYTLGVRANGALWPDFFPAVNSNGTAISNSFIPADQQGQNVTTPAECNCRCAAVSTCVAYTWLGGQQQQCWLHSYVQFYATPVTSPSDLSVPADSVLGRVVRDTSSWATCSKLSLQQGSFTGTSSTNITTPTISSVTAAGCNQACGQEPACVAFRWTGSKPTAAGNCTLYSSVTGVTPATSGTSYTGLLQACGEQLVPGPTPSVGTCGIDAAPGFRYTGKVLPGWVPLPGSGALSINQFVQRDIPLESQNQTRPNAAECNCLCTQVDACVGYTWLGGDLKQCWLHSYVEWWTRPEDLSDTYHNTEDPFTQLPVPADTVIGRRIDKTADWPLCGVGTWNYPNGFAIADNSSITAILPGPVNSSQCNQACGNDPFCVGYQWQSTDDFGNGISVGPCSLFSTAQGFGGGPPPVGAAATFCATLQRCLADSLPETYNSQLVGGNPPPAPPLPPAPQLVAAPATSCKFDASPGIRHQGQIWRSWLPVLGYGNAGDAPQTAVTTADTEVVVSPASNKYIPAGKQGVKTNSFQECNCRCAAIDTCIGYTWLGGTIQECWLHSFVNFYEDTDYVVQQSAAAGGGYIPVPSDTILGRVIKTVSNDTLPCNQTIYNAGVAPAVRTSNRIRNNPIDPVAPQDCNFRCLQDPYCVAYSWMGLDANDAALCTMYSEVSGAPTPISPPDAIFFMASLQVCKELRVAPPGPPSPPSPPPAPPTPPAPPGAAGVNGSTTCDVTADAASVGIKYTGKVWKNWAPIKGYGGSGLDQNVYASNAYISDSVQGQPADTAADCNCRCNDEAVCIGYTWLGAQRKECWLHSSVTWYSDPVDSFFDPLSPSSDPTPAPADAVLARVVPTATRSSAFVSCGLDLVQDYQPAVVNTSGITQSTDPLPPFYCASECLKEPLCVGFTWQAQSADPTNDAVCTLLSGASGGIVPVAASNGLRTFMAPLQSCRALKTSPPIPVPAPPAPPAPAPGPATACPADSSAGIKWSAGGVVLPGWWPRYRAGWSKTDAINPNTTAWSNNYIPDDMQGATTASPTECNCRCINATACVAYTWLGGAYKQCWLHSWVEWFANPVNTFQDVNTGNQVAVPADTVVARVIKAADWPLCNATGKYFSKQGIQSASSAGITRTPPRGVSWQACNQECGRDPACVAFSWTGTVDPANDPVGGNSLNCQLYSNVSGGLVFNSSENGVVYTSPLQACPEALQDLQGQAPNQGIYTTSSSSGSSSSSSLSAGAIAGIVIGAVLGTLAIAALLFAVFVWRRKPRGFNGFSAVPGSKSIVSGSTADSLWSLGLSTNQTGRHTPMAVPGLAKGEIFTRATAYEYSWLTTPLDLASVQAVEAGINDQELDTMFKSAGGSGGGELPPVIELSKEDLKQQVQLVQNGLLGRGATALVFQCVWPSRFGPNSLLAVKVLKDGHEVDPLVLQSFAYEANVLASTEHPCVIRLYGYCLEPPTVCLILELLPYSLKDLLYGIQAHADTTQPRPVHPSQLHTSQLPLTLHTGSDLSPKTMSTIQHTTGTAPPIMVVVTPEEDASNISGTHPAAPGTTPAEKQASGSLGVPPGPMTASSDAPAPMPIIRPYAVLDSRSTPDFMGTTGTSLSSTATGMALPSPGCKPPPLTMAQVLRISTEIAAGLAYLHDRPVYNTPAHLGHAVLTLEEHSPANTSLNNAGMKIVHRDLKPANILINSRGRAKISDFGLARKTQRTTVHTERLGAGTLPYMAPELLAGATSGNAYKLAPTNRVDIYSLSMMMWEMVSGQQPWSDKNEVAIMSAVIRNQRPELPNLPKTTEAAARPDIDHLPASLSALPEFNSIVRACWSQRELKRPTAAAVFNMLCGVLRQYGHAPPEDLSVTIPQPLPAPEQADEPRE